MRGGLELGCPSYKGGGGTIKTLKNKMGKGAPMDGEETFQMGTMEWVNGRGGGVRGSGVGKTPSTNKKTL